MVLEGLRAYLELASGLTEVTRQRATAAARGLVAQGEAGFESVVPAPMRAQVSILADELLATSKGNRDLLRSLVRSEVERSVTRLGLVSMAELESANRRAQQLDERVHELERELRTARKTTKTAKAGTRTVRERTPTAGAAKKSTSETSAKKSATGAPRAKKSTPGAAPTKRGTTPGASAKKGSTRGSRKT